MACRFMFASIDDCKEFRSPRFPDEEHAVIQHPVVSSATFDCSVEIPAGKTLLVGGLFPTRVERDAEQGIFDRMLGQKPAKIARQQVTYIAITPQNVIPDREAE